MFVPRALRLKGIKESKRQNISTPPRDVHSEDALVDAMQGISTNSPTPQEDAPEQGTTTRGPRFTVQPVTTEYLAQIAAGIELIFSDYAQQEPERAEWLQSRYRTVEGREKYIHLAALLEHQNISTLKPEATQISLQKALESHKSDYLEVSKNGHYVRRKPSSYPPRFLPHNSFEVVNDDGLTFWDQRTIYVEPHLRHLCQTPAKVAQWLRDHGQLKKKWLPVQAVHTLWNSCAFVILSGSVMHEDAWSKWRAAEKPEGWNVMTKVEHTKRNNEYVELLKKENPGGMRRKKIHESELPPIARPAALPMSVELDRTPTGTTVKAKRKRKRNKRKGDGLGPDADEQLPDASDPIDTEDQVEQPRSKRRK